MSARVVAIAAMMFAFVALLTTFRGSGGDRPTLTVLAASSLTEVFAELAVAFERAHPGVDVVVSTAGSQALRLQIEQGMAADLFASAHPEHLLALDGQGKLAEQTVFAHTRLAIVVPADNPAGVHSVADLARVDRLVIGAPTVPIGRYTLEFLDRASQAIDPDFARRVRARVVSMENNVRLVRAKVAVGEADAAVVYATDIGGTGAAQLRAIAIPPALNQTVAYRIARLTDARAPESARRFVQFLDTDVARSILDAYGFSSP